MESLVYSARSGSDAVTIDVPSPESLIVLAVSTGPAGTMVVWNCIPGKVSKGDRTR